MIPFVVPPLTGLAILVTRPQPQANDLAASIANWGAEPIVFPTIAIEPIVAVDSPDVHDMVIFVSVHAVEYGARFIQKTPTTRIAAIGKATAAALATVSLPADIVPDAGFTSEALLGHPSLQLAPGMRALIVRGEGGREMLRESLIAQGLTVKTLEVYRRVQPEVSVQMLSALELRWIEAGIDAVTATSFETYTNLVAMIPERARALLSNTLLVAPSHRIIDAAREAGWQAEGLVAGSADDAAILGTLARWRARARGR